MTVLDITTIHAAQHSGRPDRRRFTRTPAGPALFDTPPHRTDRPAPDRTA
ncbi:hypothetical protein [Streptomyces humi]|nr:hypothetical protein [Streptomyces humi]